MAQHAAHLAPFLSSLVHHGASDLHVKPGAPPRIRIDGKLVPLDVDPVTREQSVAWITETMDTDTRERFTHNNEVDYAIDVPGVGRFRANAFRARGEVGLVARLLSGRPQTLEELGMPEVLRSLALLNRGLVLVTGTVGSGKSTTLTAMVDTINNHREWHVLTIEDPIEVVHTEIKASITQRELRSDTASFGTALWSALRMDVDVILIGEMRDAETVRAALTAVKAGRLVLSTLHTTDAAETVNRIVDFFPAHEQQQTRLALAQSLRGVVCQRLVPRINGDGRVCAMEIMVSNKRISDAIADPEKTAELPALIAEGAYDGMRTFEQHLTSLVVDGAISITDAKAAASQPHDLTVRLRQAGVSPAAIEAA